MTETKKYTHFAIIVDAINGRTYRSVDMDINDPGFDKEYMRRLTEDPQSLTKLIINVADSNTTTIFNHTVLSSSVISIEFMNKEKRTRRKKSDATKD